MLSTGNSLQSQHDGTSHCIRKAVTSDAEAIFQIAHDNKLSDNQDQSANGFLVSDYGRNDYALFADEGNLHVLCAGSDIRAFMLKYDRAALDVGSTVNKALIAFSRDHFCVIKQICVDRQYQRHGYGKALYQQAQRECPNLFACVVTDQRQPNKQSASFHERMGFHACFTIRPDDGCLRTVYHYAAVGCGNIVKGGK